MKLIFATFIIIILACSGSITAEEITPDSGRKQHDFSDLSTNAKAADKLFRQFVEFDNPPVLLQRTTPVYPEKARQLGVEAKLFVQAFVDADGAVTKAEILKIDESKQGFGFEESALKVAREAIYKPAQKDGKPVATWIAYAVKFKLKESENSE
jgi:TonB family protein